VDERAKKILTKLNIVGPLSSLKKEIYRPNSQTHSPVALAALQMEKAHRMWRVAGE
jgi:hypothetical protein